MFCITSQGDTSQLHLATQQFHSFYHHIASNLVVAPLSGHVTNITLHQYHRATYAVKKFHSKAMIKGTIKWNRTFDADFLWGLGFWRCVFGLSQRSAKKQSKPKDRRQKTTFFPGKSAELNGTVRSLYFSLNTLLSSSSFGGASLPRQMGGPRPRVYPFTTLATKLLGSDADCKELQPASCFVIQNH